MWLFFENKEKEVRFSCVMNEGFKDLSSGEVLDSMDMDDLDISGIVSFESDTIVVSTVEGLKTLEIARDTTDGYGFNTKTKEEYYGMVLPIDSIKKGEYILTDVKR